MLKTVILLTLSNLSMTFAWYVCLVGAAYFMFPGGIPHA